MDIYGVDFESDIDGKTHFCGTANRSDAFWQHGKRSIIEGIKKMQKIDIDVQLHSDLFRLEEESDAIH